MEKLFIGADHGGFEFKGRLVEILKAKGYDITDLGPHTYEKDDDYPDYAEIVCKRMANGEGKGILICRSGQGMCIAANKFRKIRAAVCWNEEAAQKAKKDDDINVICLPGDMISVEEAAKTISRWLETPFESVERRTRRLKKIDKIEDQNFK